MRVNKNYEHGQNSQVAKIMDGVSHPSKTGVLSQMIMKMGRARGKSNYIL